MPSATLTITLELTIDVSGRITRAQPTVGVEREVQDIEIDAIHWTQNGKTFGAVNTGEMATNGLSAIILAQRTDQIVDALLENAS